jgi:hypothetical protein
MEIHGSGSMKYVKRHTHSRDGNDSLIEHQFVTLHRQLMGSCDEVNSVIVSKVICDVSANL